MLSDVQQRLPPPAIPYRSVQFDASANQDDTWIYVGFNVDWEPWSEKWYSGAGIGTLSSAGA